MPNRPTPSQGTTGMAASDFTEVRNLLMGISEDVGEVKSVVAEVKVQAKLTNGRVTALEREQIKREEREKILKEFAAAQVVKADRDEKRQVRRKDAWEWRAGFVVTVVVGAAAVSAAVAHLI